jgi:hypothetical protein
MSQLPTPPPSPPPARNGCLTALMIGAGIVLLLPGVCAVLIVTFDPQHGLGDQTTLMACIGLFAVAAGGIALIWTAVRRPR